MTTEIKTDKDGTIRYFKNGLRHREDGPAVIWADGTIRYFKNGLRHREDGPAVYAPTGYTEWWLKDCRYDFNRWCQKVKITVHQKTLLMLKYNT